MVDGRGEFRIMDPAAIYKYSPGTGAVLCFMGAAVASVTPDHLVAPHNPKDSRYERGTTGGRSKPATRSARISAAGVSAKRPCGLSLTSAPWRRKR